jgi:ketosteroid isomerase-like protein
MNSLEKAWDNLIEIATRKDLEAVSEIVLDDIVLSVDTQVWTGKEAYLGVAGEVWKNVSPKGYYKSENTKIEVSNDGTLGYVFGTHTFLKTEDDSVFDHVHHLYVWKKHEDVWKMTAIHISHPPKQ